MDTAAGLPHSGRQDAPPPRDETMAERSRDALYTAIEIDGQRLAIGLIRLVHAMSDGSGLNPTDFQCYLLLKIGGPLSPGAIADGLRLASGSATGVIDRLEARGLVRRERHPDDRRKVVVRLCAEPQEERAPSPGMRDAMTAVHEHYSDAQLAVIADWLDRVGAALDDVASSMHRG